LATASAPRSSARRPPDLALDRLLEGTDAFRDRLSRNLFGEASAPESPSISASSDAINVSG